ncbi:hypothetical protein [Vibrio sp. McD22-P3]|uniref:hypothetical protein n=1 Tax=Vibrio sp. McD22-P3 TaxID=2724880 RepID=UPI001F45ADBE|nr:hypothetical protein [Vibrio sp. McD22-P3]MCF4175267.1 hypothetical protein [Vibrio sp. McD22-P3]
MSSRIFGFVSLAAIGWVIDLVFMTFLVYLLVEPGIANFISANIAATFVYWSARAFVYRVNVNRASFYGYLIYIMYTIGIVALFSLLIQLTSVYLNELLVGSQYEISLVSTALAVKVFYTPFNLALNYLVSSKLANLNNEYKN